MSRCTSPQYSNLKWHDYPADAATVKQIGAWINALPSAVRADISGKILALRTAALEGTLSLYDKVAKEGDVRGLSSAPFMWELRWECDGRLLRQYHGEPPHMSNYLISTHFHEKLIGQTEEETRELQQAEINKAHSRYNAGKPVNWGIDIARW